VPSELNENNKDTRVKRSTEGSCYKNVDPKSVMHQTTASFDDYLNKLTDKTHFLLLDDLESVMGWAVLFERDHGRWFALVIDKILQGKGHGTELLTKLKESEQILNGWVVDFNSVLKENGELYRSPLTFYIKNGFNVYPHKRFESEAMSTVMIQWPGHSDIRNPASFTIELNSETGAQVPARTESERSGGSDTTKADSSNADGYITFSHSSVKNF
jgi:hypothetical protein